jgi:hypothetical protein
MAQKRGYECFEEEANTKFIKQMEENDSDVTLDNACVSEDLNSFLEYDFVMKTFSVTLEKERKDGKRCICFGTEEIASIIRFLPAIEKLVDRYSSKRSPKVIDIPFEACSANIGDSLTVVSLKENTFKRGSFDVDIRKCIKKEDGNYQYTQEGVRFAHTHTTALRENLLGYQSLIVKATDKSKRVISMTAANAIIREINELADPRENCEGCQTQHLSQNQHMGYSGCLTTEQPTWEQLCDQYWQAGKGLIREDNVQD